MWRWRCKWKERVPIERQREGKKQGRGVGESEARQWRRPWWIGERERETCCDWRKWGAGGLGWFGYKLGFRVFVVMKGMVTMSGGGNAGIVFVFFKTYKNHFSFLQKIRENSWLFCSSQKTEPTYFFLLFYDSYFYFFFVIQSNQIKIIINKNRIRIFFGE